MRTEFKIFESEFASYSLENAIKEYQEKHNLEIRNIVLIKSNDVETIIGVVSEKRIWYEKRKYRNIKRGLYSFR